MLAGGQIPSRLAVAYTAYLLVAWNRLHHLYDSPDQVFRRPDAGEVDRLFGGTAAIVDWFAGLPA
jgi:hypothetical protein